MATQIVMDHTGDRRHQFDPADLAEVARAERLFRNLTGAGFTAAVRTAGTGHRHTAMAYRLDAAS